MNFISNILFWISTGLLVPVIVLLIFFFVRALILLGGFFGHYMQMRKVNAALDKKIATLTVDTLGEFEKSLPAESQAPVLEYMRKITLEKNNHARIDLLLSEYEIEADKNLGLSKTLTKMGPILGLMGTLIPMGPALVGLAAGDIGSMAYNMQVAFATTVVGLVASAIGFVTQTNKERWYVKDMAMLEYVAEIVKQSSKKAE